MSTAPGSKIPQQTFLAILWVGTSISFAFLFFRICIKIRSFRKLHVDDYLVMLAWIMMLASAVVWQREAPTYYVQSAILAGKMLPSGNFFHDETIFLRCLGALNITYWSSLYLIKLSFLFFFRRLRAPVKGQVIWWWCVLAIAICGWIVSILDYDYKCIYVSYEYILARCETEKNTRFVNATFYANCACDVLSDVLILSIPIIMLWRVRIPIRKKLALIATFSVTIIVIVVALIRITAVSKPNQNFDLSWVFFWNYIEMTTALILTSVAAFRQLFVTNQSRSNNSGSSSPWSIISALLSRLKISREPKGSLKWPSPSISKRSPDSSGFSEEPQQQQEQLPPSNRIVPFQGVYIDRSLNSVTGAPAPEKPPRLRMPDLRGPPYFRWSGMQSDLDRIGNSYDRQSMASG